LMLRFIRPFTAIGRPIGACVVLHGGGSPPSCSRGIIWDADYMAAIHQAVFTAPAQNY
jgi:hypothetical protein